MKSVEGVNPSGLKIIREPGRNLVTKTGVDELRNSGASERLLEHAMRALGPISGRATKPRSE